MLCYVTQLSLTFLEAQGPRRHTRPYKSPLECLCTVMVCSGSHRTVFCHVVVFFHKNPISLSATESQNGILSIPACIALIFHKAKHSGLSPQRWPCDKERISVCLNAFCVRQKLKTVTHTHTQKKCLPRMCLLSKVIFARWALMKRQSNHFDLHFHIFYFLSCAHT